MKSKFFLYSLLALFSFSLFMAPLSVSAEINTDGNVFGGLDQVTGQTEAYTTGKGQGETQIYAIISRVINIILGFIGLILLILVIVSGVQWMTSAGNEEKITSAKKRLISSIIGLVIILAAAVISNFALDLIQKSINTSTAAGTTGP